MTDDLKSVSRFCQWSLTATGLACAAVLWLPPSFTILVFVYRLTNDGQSFTRQSPPSFFPHLQRAEALKKKAQDKSLREVEVMQSGREAQLLS